MNVNSFNRTLRSSAIKFFAAIVIAFCAIFFLAAFITDKSEEEIFSKRINLVVRAIGHNLLLQAGDSTSAVLPVVEKSKGVFLLEFENEFVFQPDTLVAIVHRFLVKTELSQYTVTVQECHSPSIVYGFEINPPNNSIKPCGGRHRPKGCYNIEIAFTNFPDPAFPYAPIGVMAVGLPLVLAIVLISRKLGSKKLKPLGDQHISIQNEINPNLTVGRFVFDTTHQRLRIGKETISLTDKECRILTLLNRNIEALTLREELVQQVWTDEGVITGRSLDMFISKLRKKLSADPGIRITNIHGKGYRLEIVNDSIAP